jgi:hypothetical protein
MEETTMYTHDVFRKAVICFFAATLCVLCDNSQAGSKKKQQPRQSKPQERSKKKPEIVLFQADDKPVVVSDASPIKISSKDGFTGWQLDNAAMPTTFYNPTAVLGAKQDEFIVYHSI